ncbi:hypothetical protein [Rhizobium laguerreae]|uniref:hypothetical protein n=1 Tax=Rhizobium laguerreae TaxID=1076926 RepID=UPI001C902FF7|nr:hypothetical protein [Rhizobium laguerreae]MBY3314727.1 hypothetical protein [Rhizobium laguerreae]
MRKIQRGPEPQSLIDARAVELLKARKHFIEDQKVDGFEFSAYKKAKGSLKDLTGGNCAYCEAYYDVTSPVDLEHYRPKGAIETTTERVSPGYWWLAAVWENLLPSCIRCNREEIQPLYDGTMLKVGKGERFPIFAEADRASAEDGEMNERPILIDPAEDDPTDYIKFVEEDERCIAKCVDETETTENGRRARASIDIYGLNREGLVTDRSRQLLRAQASLRHLELAVAELDRMGAAGHDTAFVELTIARETQFLGSLTAGNDRFTGMLRCLIYPELQRMGIAPW